MNDHLDELLEVVKNHDPKDYSRIICEKKEWEFLYNLSPARENVISWLPILSDSKVLEINAECGAITGLLCSKAKFVQAIDPSEKKCLINECRNKQHENLKVTTADPRSFLESSSEKHDLITIVGKNSIDSELLKSLRSAITPNGYIVITAENRLGLKYLSGYKDNEIDKYTKNELESIIRDAGFTEYEFYYPYPDVTFTNSVYSDSRLPSKDELMDNIRNFDKERLIFWDESLVYNDLITEEIYPEFSNSFLVILGNRNNVSYAKISDERDIRFQVITEIIDNGTDKTVLKKCKTSDGMNHIRTVKENELTLRNVFGDKVDVCNSTLCQDGLKFEYIDGISLDKVLSFACEKKSVAEICKILDEYYNIIKLMESEESFTITEGFTKVFGNVDVPENTAAGKIVDIDLILPNIIVRDGKHVVIDYEWVFDFPIPLEYVFWKGLFSSVAFSKLDDNTKTQIYDHYGLTEDNRSLYLQMESSFQKYVSGDTLTLRDYINAKPLETKNVDHLTNEISTLKRSLQETVNELTSTRNDLLKTGDILNETRVELESTKNELQIIKNSKSWKILKALRIVRG